MDTQQKLLFSLCSSLLFLFTGNTGVEGWHHYCYHDCHHSRVYRSLFNAKPSKLFVFGDSYADTGNSRKSIASSWKAPYGMTFPGKPTGRFSDGRILTDYLASFVGLKSPIPYQWRQTVGVQQLKNGVNFAYGGTGVFDTLAPYRNLTTQIDCFQQMINGKIYTHAQLRRSAALVSFVGEDYTFHLATNGSVQGFPAFAQQVVDQLVVNLKRILDLGVERVVVTGLQPLGCLPSRTAQSSFRQCNETENKLADFHNALLQTSVSKLNADAKSPKVVVLDLYSAFKTVLENKKERPEGSGRNNYSNPLSPCCAGVSSGYSCGSVDEKGAKMYTVCEDPKSAFFWDMNHPTQEGWRAIYSALQANLQKAST